MAKKFKFRMETVLKLRQQREQMARRKLMEARAAVTTVEDQMRRVRGQMAEQDDLVRQGVLTGTVDVPYMSLYRRHMMSLHRRMMDHAVRLRELAGHLQQARSEVLEAVKRRKVLSTLKDKLSERHLSRLDKLEQREMDDITGTRHLYLQLAGEPG
jgi:flagellar export protein FliJ